jgi:bilirubin oxidase
VSRAALATYDATGQTAATVSQSATTSYTASGTSTAPTITNTGTTPTTPNSTDPTIVTASIAAATGRTISSAQLTYNTGSSASVVFYETMGAAATSQWDGSGAVFAWTRVFTGTQTAFRQSTAGNHTAVGDGNQFGFETIGCSPNIAQNTITTTNNINATGTSGTVEFYVSTAGMTGAQGWDFQTSTDGTTWTTRVSDLNIPASYGFTLKSYTLSAPERVSTLKLRFRFAGGGMNMVPAIRLDDIKVTIGSTASPVNVTMYDDGAHGDGPAGDAVYGASIPAQATGTTVTYAITATDSTNVSTTSPTNSYTTITGAAAMVVTPGMGLNASGYVGGGFSPSSTSYTITNSGTASMNWTASKTQSWLTLSGTSGTLAVGGSATLIATINSAANSLALGSYSDTITFTNSTNGSGNTSRAVSLVVKSNTPPSAPALSTLGTFTQGKSKTISWSAVPGATSYTLEISTTADFATVLGAQTVSTTSAGFSNLTDGATYYYRLIATNAVGSSGYSNVVSTTQDNTSPTVAITSPASGISTASASIVVSGTASDATSGIAKVTVNAVTAATSNNFATWSVTAPLGFGTNGITAVAYDGAGNVATTAVVRVALTTAQTYNPLVIPEVMTGTTFNLNLHTTTKQFFAGAATNTYSYNNMLFWGPTLVIRKGDLVQMNVTNSLIDTTTTHWHGLHIPAIMDGGPHQTIPAGTTWSPSFYMRNNAGTYWYHPHLHTTTQQQVTMGGGGLMIVQDDEESALPLPRAYGVDDIPIVMASRRYIVGGGQANQFQVTPYGDYALVNGTLSAQVNLPAQVVRMRILNGEVERSHNLGFSDNRTFYVIATDGGLVNAPIPVTRLQMAVAERYEILVDLTGVAAGTTLDLRTFNAQFANTPGYPGGPGGTTGPGGSLLNGVDYTDLHINVVAQTANPITAIPTALANNVYWTGADVTNTRTVTITGTGGAPLAFDNLVYSPSVINQTLNLDAVEQWNLVNNSGGASHSFHIHDIQFYVTSYPGGVPSYMQGWKDSIYIAPNTSLSFIAKFDHFASNTNPFMFHCHFLNHEDGGLMGQFLVRNNAVEDLAIASFTRTGGNSLIQLDFKATPGTTYTLQYSPDMTTGNWIDIGSVTSDGASATFTETDAARLGLPRGFYRVAIPAISE